MEAKVCCDVESSLVSACSGRCGQRGGASLLDASNVVDDKRVSIFKAARDIEDEIFLQRTYGLSSRCHASCSEVHPWQATR